MQQGNQNNVLQNPQMQGQDQSAGPQMNDRDRLNDCLSSCKWLTDNLNIMARESSHRALHQDVLNILVETHQSARDAFNLMFELGHYKMEVEDAQKIQQAQQQFQNYAQTQFPNASGGMMQ